MNAAKSLAATTKPAFPVIVLLAYGVFWAWMAIAPANRFDWLLENLLVFLCVGVLIGTYRWFPLSHGSYVGIALFLALHTYGSHGSYGATPIDPLLQLLFGGGRLPYDRLVHLAYGVLLAGPIREALMRLAGLRGFAADALAVAVVLATGAFYELIEMWVAGLVAPEMGALFLGSQGDPWDAQHDMELELFGAMAVLGLGALLRRFTLFAK
ncbi:DUF2238 domain-containing protein [Paenibacillus sp. MZ04-78.2]|uniref:DUF2238 domain-containing protein n=1 Tax=Paenibacillus sp. MZ04-78.2 TaxID=2962034 RepID=UPI0020B77060|nr:DUF2238 domain-containing protein [Paenibacillus sp. MZ04-78.2]MCP3775248.1 DUF2238 domain-containing protein [Paenibacillus sp. MZ04-78.2]